MNQKDITEKIKKDLVIIEEKLLNHYAFKKDSLPALRFEADDIKGLTRTYLDMMQNNILFENIEDLSYCKLRIKAIDEIYENIKIRSNYYLMDNKDTNIPEYNIFYKIMMCAFDNTVKIYKNYQYYVNNLTEKINKQVNELLVMKIPKDNQI